MLIKIIVISKHETSRELYQSLNVNLSVLLICRVLLWTSGVWISIWEPWETVL